MKENATAKKTDEKYLNFPYNGGGIGCLWGYLWILDKTKCH